MDYGLRVRLCSGCSALKCVINCILLQGVDFYARASLCSLVKGKKLVEDLSDMPKDDPTIFTLCYSQGGEQDCAIIVFTSSACSMNFL